MDVRLVGEEIAFMAYSAFNHLGGLIYNVPQEAVCTIDPSISEEHLEKFKQWVEQAKKYDWNPKEYEIHTTFNVCSVV